MSRNTTKVFVYGTLKRDKYFHDKYLGTGVDSLGPGYADVAYSLYVDVFPMLVREPSDRSVKGELYRVDAGLLAKLDGLEGENRELIDVLDEDGNKHSAWAYLHPASVKMKRGVCKEYEWE